MTTTLYNRQAGSDKVYQVTVQPISLGTAIVTFAYGRRGSTLTTGTKTPEPVRDAVAMDIAQKLIRAKQAGGYVIATDGQTAAAVAPPVSSTPAAEPTLPMLLNSITEAEVRTLLNDPRWCLQEKHDGKRMTIHSDGQHVTALNKRGLPCGFPATVQRAMLSIDACVLDGEMVGDVFYAFDVLEHAGLPLASTTYQYRLGYLSALCEAAGPAVQEVKTFFAYDKERHWLQLREDNAEGVVFKDLHAAWSSGRPNTGGPALKFKFTETASFITGPPNTSRSVPLFLHSGPSLRSVGNVTIPPNHTVPASGSIVEVRYLYAFPGGSVFQPVYLGPRDDVTRRECHVSQLKLKAA